MALRSPCPAARSARPRAAVVFPLPFPVYPWMSPLLSRARPSIFLVGFPTVPSFPVLGSPFAMAGPQSLIPDPLSSEGAGHDLADVHSPPVIPPALPPPPLPRDVCQPLPGPVVDAVVAPQVAGVVIGHAELEALRRPQPAVSQQARQEVGVGHHVVAAAEGGGIG